MRFKSIGHWRCHEPLDVGSCCFSALGRATARTTAKTRHWKGIFTSEATPSCAFHTEVANCACAAIATLCKICCETTIRACLDCTITAKVFEICCCSTTTTCMCCQGLVHHLLARTLVGAKHCQERLSGWRQAGGLPLTVNMLQLCMHMKDS